MDGFKLINMNGRVYDPLLGSFLIADPVIQSPDNTQSYNRYSYCVNNPLMFTDPSGYSHSTPIEYYEGLNQRFEDRMSVLEFGGSGGYGGGGGHFAPVDGYSSLLDVISFTYTSYDQYLVKVEYGENFRFYTVTNSHTVNVRVRLYGYTPSPISGYVSGDYGGGRPSINTMSSAGNSDSGASSTHDDKYLGVRSQSSSITGVENSNSIFRHIIGPSLVLLSLPYYPKPGGVDGGGETGKWTSPAAKGLRKADEIIQRRLHTNVKLPAKGFIHRTLGTRGIGAALGRFVPYVGIAISGLDVGWSLGVKYGPSKWFKSEPEVKLDLDYLKAHHLFGN